MNVLRLGREIVIRITPIFTLCQAHGIVQAHAVSLDISEIVGVLTGGLRVESKRMTAEEIAETLYKKLLTPRSSLDYSDPTILISEALIDFGNQRYREGLEQGLFDGKMDALRSRHDALKECLQIVDKSSTWLGMRDKIKSLLDKKEGV